jgi:hypothetical protein
MVMRTETHLERRLDRLIAHAVTPRRAAAVIAAVMIVITLAAGEGTGTQSWVRRHDEYESD